MRQEGKKKQNLLGFSGKNLGGKEKHAGLNGLFFGGKKKKKEI